MFKCMKAIGMAAGLLIALACGVSDLPTTSAPQQEPSPTVVQDRAVPTSTGLPDGQSTNSADSQPAPSLRPGTLPPTFNPTPTPRHGIHDNNPEPIAESVPEQKISSFLQEIGREYPGLLDLPDCSSSTQLTMAPLEGDAYIAIVPLGLLSTPQWVLPSSHVYYHLVRETPASGGYGPPAIAEIRAPGDIRILRVDSSESMGGPRGDYIDYEITFASCRERMYKLLHVSTLNPQLEELFEATQADRCDEYRSAESQFRLCTKKLNMDLTVGTVIGNAGGKVSSALDLEAYDLAGPSLAYVNPARFRPRGDLRLKVVCPFDDFSADLRERQLARMGGDDRQLRTVAPRCGEVMQDIPGTAQGNWYTGEMRAQVDWSQQMGLVHDNVDPNLAAISIGGKVTDAGVWLFRPESSGLVNRDFPDVSADGRTYCYEGAMNNEGGRTPAPFPGRLLISLTSDTEMMVEQQDGGCADGPGFVAPLIYKR